MLKDSAINTIIVLVSIVVVVGLLIVAVVFQP